MISKYLLFFGQVLAHIALIAALFTFSFADWGISFFVYFLTGCLGISVTYHRYISHRSWQPPKWWIYVGSLLGFYGLVGSPLAWANNHVAHHRYTDTEKDPHSPMFQPWWKVQWGSMFTSYTGLRYCTKHMNTFQIFIHKNYFYIHAVILVTLLLLLGVHMTMVVYLVPAAILWNMASLVNTINHSKFGYRNFNTRDSSVNNFITGYMTFGEGWHNNHHSSPGKYNFSARWWEFDISKIIISLLNQKTTS